MTHTPTPAQPEALQKAGAIAFRLHRAGDRQAAASIRALLSRVHELETQTAHMADLVEQADYARQKMEEAQARVRELEARENNWNQAACAVQLRNVLRENKALKAAKCTQQPKEQP